MRCVRFLSLLAIGLFSVVSAGHVLADHSKKPKDCDPPVIHCGTPNPTPPGHCGTPNPPTTPPVVPTTGNGPVVRDHRHPPVSTGPIVRDHRHPVVGTGPVIRDHRKPTFPAPIFGAPPAVNSGTYHVPTIGGVVNTSNASGGVVVTSSGSGPIIRDHRTPPKPKNPKPIVMPTGGSSSPFPLPVPKLPVVTVHLPF